MMTPETGFGIPRNWTDLTAIALVLFTAAQLGLAWWNETRRKAEREADQRDREHVAYGALWAEYARMMSLAAQWETRDLVKEAFLGMFDPSEIMPRDWGASTQHLGELGRLSADFGGASYMNASQAAFRGHTIANVMTLLKENSKNTPSEFPELEAKHPAAFRIARKAESDARVSAREAEGCLKDALENSRPGGGDLPYTEIRFASSNHGKWLRSRLSKAPPVIAGAVEATPEPAASQDDDDESSS